MLAQAQHSTETTDQLAHQWDVDRLSTSLAIGCQVSKCCHGHQCIALRPPHGCIVLGGLTTVQVRDLQGTAWPNNHHPNTQQHSAASRVRYCCTAWQQLVRQADISRLVRHSFEAKKACFCCLPLFCCLLSPLALLPLLPRLLMLLLLCQAPTVCKQQQLFSLAHNLHH